MANPEAGVMPQLPSFATQRLWVCPRTLSELEACLAMDGEAEVLRFIPRPWSTPAQHRSFIEDRILRHYPPGLGYWSLSLKSAERHFIGWVLLIPYDAVGPEIEIGWRLRPAFWGQGYAAEAARPVLHHAFTSAALDRVVADIDPANTRSRRVAEKLGLRLASGAAAPGQALQRFCAERAVWLSSADRDAVEHTPAGGRQIGQR